MIYKFINLVLVFGLIVGCDTSTTSYDASAVSNTTNISPVFPAAYVNFPMKAGGACAFDKPVVVGDSQFISGWAFISATDGVLAETIVLGIDTNNSEKFAEPSKTIRDDVAKYFKNQAMLESGFAAYLNKVEIPSGSKIRVYQVFQGVVYKCEVTANI